MPASRVRIQALQDLDGGGRLLRRLLHARGREGGGVELADDARPVALELGEDQLTRPHAREAGVCVGRVFVGGDAALFEELPHVAPPNVEPRAHVMAAAGRHAAQAGEPTPPQ